MFLDADPRISENITLGIAANKSLHDTYLCVEPVSDYLSGFWFKNSSVISFYPLDFSGLKIAR